MLHCEDKKKPTSNKHFEEKGGGGMMKVSLMKPKQKTKPEINRRALTTKQSFFLTQKERKSRKGENSVLVFCLKV